MLRVVSNRLPVCNHRYKLPVITQSYCHTYNQQQQQQQHLSYFKRKSTTDPAQPSTGESQGAGGLFKHKTQTNNDTTNFDLIIIGGGSGGLALSKEASLLGKNVAVIDYVDPSPQGTTWGLGGTCVNVGCIPKKLMHYSGTTHDWRNMSEAYGWKCNKDNTTKFDWHTLVDNIQLYIKSLNFGYRSRLQRDQIKYINAKARFIDKNTIETTNKQGNKQILHGNDIAIAVGGRPKLPDIEGSQHIITSDDIFSLKQEPGKALIIGAAYIALETAGFLTSLGYDTTVMSRSIFLRGFDQQCANNIVDYMSRHGTKFIRNKIPVKVVKLDSGKLRVYYKDSNTKHNTNITGYQLTDKQTVDNPTQSENSNPDTEQYDDYDTVFAAIGRTPNVHPLNLQSTGVRLHDKSGKIIVDHNTQQTNVSNIYAFGDVVHGGLELTPVAIQAGKMLGKRLYAHIHDSTTHMDYSNVATTIFTPLEYSCCGLSEEQAIDKYGSDNIEIYHSYFTPLQYTLPHRDDDLCYVKVITRQYNDAVDDSSIPVNAPSIVKQYIHKHNSSKYEKVIGVHFLGPDAAEVMQGYAVAMRTGHLTKSILEQTITIHPSNAEEIILADITKRSEVDPKKTGC